MIDDQTLERLRQNGDQPEPLFEKVCANPACGVPLARRDGEKTGAFNRRKSCGSYACKKALSAAAGLKASAAAKAARHRPPLPPRHCPVCAELLVRRDGEEGYKFRQRRTCGRPECLLEVRQVAGRKANEAAAKTAPPVRATDARKVEAARRIREEWASVGQYGMTRDSLARMLGVTRNQVDAALDSAA